MSDIKKIKVNNTTYNIKDDTARNSALNIIETLLPRKTSLVFCDYFRFYSSNTGATNKYQFVNPRKYKGTSWYVQDDSNIMFASTEIRAYDQTTVLKRGLFFLAYGTSAKVGKVLEYHSRTGYTYGEVDLDLTDRLPQTTSADAGKVLTVDSSGAWGVANPATELPAVTSSDEGKVLTVNSSGEWEAATPSSGGSDETLLAHIAPSPAVVFNKTNAGLLEDFITAIKNNWANFNWTNRHRAIIVGSNSMGGKHYGNAINVCWQFNSSTKPNELLVLEFDFMSGGTILHFSFNNNTYTVTEIVGMTTGVTYTDVSSETGYNIKMTEFWLYQ